MPFSSLDLRYPFLELRVLALLFRLWSRSLVISQLLLFYLLTCFPRLFFFHHREARRLSLSQRFLRVEK